MRNLNKELANTIIFTCVIGMAFLLIACTDVQENASAGDELQSAKMKVTYVDANGAHALLGSEPEAMVLDIRTPKEIDEGYIDGAVFANFNDDDFAEQLSKLDRDTQYIVHCKGGGRSTKALITLAELGFTQVTHLDGGLDDWKRKNLPLTTP